MTRLGRGLAAAMGTAAAMLVLGWGLPMVAIAGPRPGPRIALLLPQLELSALLLLGLPRWAVSLGAERSPALRRALAATPSGRSRAVARAARAHLATTLEVLSGGAVAWLGACLVARDIPLGVIARTRCLLLIFAVFGIGLGLWVSARARHGATALALCAGVVLGLAVIPFAIGPVVSALGARPALLQAAVLVNPWLVVAGASGLDLLRMQWIYAFSPLGSLDVHAPGLGGAVTLYGLTGLFFLGASVAAVRPHAEA